MTTAARSLDRPRSTFGDVASLDPDRQGGELVAGEWVPVTRNTWKHGEIVGNAYLLLRLWAQASPGWSVSVGDPGTKLGTEPDVLRGPDVGVVRRERVPTGAGEGGWLEGAPDLAVEVLGDAQRMTAAMEKGLEFLGAGARLVWLVDPGARRVLVLTPPDHVRIVATGGELDGGDVLPGFRCRVDELFAS